MKRQDLSLDNVLAHYVPRHVRAMGHGDEPSRRDFDGVLLLLDIAGFTALTEAFATQGAEGAERLSGVLDLYFDTMTGIAIAHGGDVLDLVGDALVVAWECEGLPGETERLAVQCGVALMQALPGFVAQTETSLRHRVSLARGRLAHFMVGGVEGKWRSLTAGSPLNEAAAYQAEDADGVVICPSLWAVVAAFCQARPLPRGGATVTRVHTTMPLPSASELVANHPINHPAMRLDRYIAQPLLEHMRMADSRWLGEFRQVTTLFVGLHGVDCIRNDSLSALQAAVTCVMRVHGRLGGSLTRVSSDDKGVTLLSAFGLPLTAHEDDVAHAIAAAQAIGTEMAQQGIVVNVGVTTGRVFYADIGGVQRRFGALTGSAVNLAARLMMAANGGILCDEVTRQAAAEDYLFEPNPPIPAKGFLAPVAVWRPRERVARARRAFTGAAVGRDTEMARMALALQDAVSGRSAAVTLRGEAGIGKSRLIADVVVRAQARGMRVASGAAYALEASSVYFPWRQILSQLLCDGAAFDAACARASARALVADDERLTSWLSLLDDVLPLQFSLTEMALQIEGQSRATSLRQLMMEIVLRSARQRPLLLVADDLHWFDDASALLLIAVVSARASGLMVLVATRPLDGRAATFATDVLAETSLIDLNALTPPGVSVLIARQLGVAGADASLVEFVTDRSGGNPLYAEEVILALKASDQLSVHQGMVCLGNSVVSSATLADGLRGIIVSRIDALGAAEQLALKIAAVIGREFSLAMLKDLLPSTEITIDLVQVAQTLEREDVVRPVRMPEAGYRFKHTLLQDTVYGQLPFSLRQELHGAVALWIEQHDHENIDSRLAELALHWERARNIPSAVNYLERSAALALRRYANRDAIGQASRALRLAEHHKLPPDAVREMLCEALLGDAHNELFEYRAAELHFKRALACAGRPAPGSTAALLADLGWQLVVQLCARAGLRLPRSSNPQLPWASHIHEKLGEMAYFGGGKLPLLHATLTSLNLAERSGTVREAVDGLGALAIGFYGAGQHGLSRVYNRRSLALAEAKGGLADIAYAHLVNGVYHAAQGHWEASTRSLTYSVSLYSRLGAAERWQQAFGGLCAVELMRGRFNLADGWLNKLRPAKRDTPAQIAAYLYGFDTCAALACARPLNTLVARLQELVAVPELPQFDRLLCQGVLASAHWQGNDQAAALRSARAGLASLSAGTPGAWYLTEGLAGIAQTLIDAAAAGVADWREARRACRALQRYAKAIKVAAPRAALVAGQLAWAEGRALAARAKWHHGLRLARDLGMGYDEALLLQALGSAGARDDFGQTQFAEQAHQAFQRLGARPRGSDGQVPNGRVHP